ncbi:hypothetical protein SANA_09020 [Gottschalkiaceae bacterium SANA]|nr:hypothetical protein SANA_09020 [Gottschalkiaceae bacterium SANA]
MRTFLGNPIELLAPVGNYAIFKKLLHSKADAFYLGGKQLNMRMHRSQFNFTMEEMKDAIIAAHALDKKIYITVNNLVSSDEIESAKDYLLELEDLQPDALIIQDLAIVSLIQEMDLNLEMHASVMMNVHNQHHIDYLQKQGFTRVVTSREIDLKTVRKWVDQTGIEIEYFAHGDMCSINGATCYYSSMVFGQSSNCGRCMKPCRWSYQSLYKGKLYETAYPLAAKDMSMYPHIPEMLESGVVSFKIEGRMREADFLLPIINAYGDAIDSYLADPLAYDRFKDSEALFEQRMRDPYQSFAFGNPGSSAINERYEGTGYFYSHGHVFSKPVDEHDIKDSKVNELNMQVGNQKNQTSSLLVSLQTEEQLKIALNSTIDQIEISTEVFDGSKGISADAIRRVVCNHPTRNFIIRLPRAAQDHELAKLEQWLSVHQSWLKDRVILRVSTMGQAILVKKFNIQIAGDLGLNLYNEKTANRLLAEGFESGIASIELKAKDLMALADHSQLPLELVVFGSPTMMLSDLDFVQHLEEKQAVGQENSHYFSEEVLVLRDDKGFEHPVYRDQFKRNHVRLNKDINLTGLWPSLKTHGFSTFRLEMEHFQPTDFQTALDYWCKLKANDGMNTPLDPIHAGFTLGALGFEKGE